MFHLQYVLDGLSFAFLGCSLEKNLQLWVVQRYWGTQESKCGFPALVAVFLPAMEMYCSAGVAVM